MAAAGAQGTLAVFGGSFDPPHMGHVLAMAFVASAYAPEGILMVPAFEHPFGKQPAASFAHRVTMCELAARAVTGVHVSRIERDLGGTSRTLRTLEALARSRPGARLRLLVGADVLPDTPRWHRWDRIVAIAPPIVVGRAGYARPEGCPFDIPDVSSTELRSRLARRSGTDGMLPAAVETYIVEQGLYRMEEGT
jgi:nicotinate-nucleotide adenylyltransferase